MALTEYLQVLYRRKWIIVLAAVTTLGAVMIGRALIPPTQTATAVLRIVMYPSINNASYTQIMLIDRIMNTYVKIATSNPVLAQIRQTLDLQPDSPEKINVELIPDTELLRITVRDSNPRIAQSFTEELVTMLVENPIKDSRIYVVEPSHFPESSPLRAGVVQAGLALIVGAIGGIGLAFIVDSLDTRLHTTEQIVDTTKLRILGEIPACRINDGKLLVEAPPCSNEFKRLGMNLLTEAHKSNLRVLLITSARPKEGKSTVAASLAYSMVQLGQNVTLIDANLYHPSLLKYFAPTSQANLQKLRSDDGPLANGLGNIEFTGIYFLDQSILPGDSPEPFQTEFHSIPFEQSRGPSDIVLIDSPAFLGVADAATWIPRVDGVLVVARLGWTREPEITKTCEQLAYLNANLVGIVVNGTKSQLSGVFRHYYKNGKAIPIREIPPSKGLQAANGSKTDLELPEPEVNQSAEEIINSLALPEPAVTPTPANLNGPSQQKGNSRPRRVKRNS